MTFLSFLELVFCCYGLFFYCDIIAVCCKCVFFLVSFIVFFFFFFFSSRRRHTRWNCDWSSDVCSSDLSSPQISEHTASRSLAKAMCWPSGDHTGNRLTPSHEVRGTGDEPSRFMT